LLEPSYASEWDCYLTRRYADSIAALPAQLWIRAKPHGLRLLEKYATHLRGDNHRMGLDDAVMMTTTLPQLVVSARRFQFGTICLIPNNRSRNRNLRPGERSLDYKADIIMLDNMALELMSGGKMIRSSDSQVKN